MQQQGTRKSIFIQPSVPSTSHPLPFLPLRLKMELSKFQGKQKWKTKKKGLVSTPLELENEACMSVDPAHMIKQKRL
jgi:hypothetical protein